MTSHDLLLFAVPVAAAAALPGPAQGALVARVVAEGSRTVMPFVAGMVIGNSCWLLAAIAGLAALASHYAALFAIVKWVGVAYLLFVAWRMWNTPTDPTPRADASPVRGLLSGALLTASNPKAVLFFGAVLPQAFDVGALSGTDVWIVVALGAAIDLGVQVTYVMAAARLRRVMVHPARRRVIHRASALTLGGCAALIAARRT